MYIGYKVALYMRLLNKIFLVLLMLLGVCIAFGAYIYSSVSDIDKTYIKKHEKNYVLKSGDGVSTVVHNLLSDNYSSYTQKIWIYLNKNKFNNIQKGEYVIDGKKTLVDILTDMQEGRVYVPPQLYINISEGMQYDLILKRLSNNKEIFNDLNIIDKDKKVFMQKTLNDEALINALGGLHDSLEGLLLADTYALNNKKEASYIIKKSLYEMAVYMQKMWPYRDDSINLKSPYEALILASLVEKESSRFDERGMIAGVFYNRLNKNMRLQTDPSVMYGVSPLFRGPLRVSQLKKDTPYNTYTRAGLPPTPIAMPSRETIEAVLHPVHTDAIYFVAKGPDPKEGHHFSATLKEHTEAVANYRRAVREYKQKENIK